MGSNLEASEWFWLLCECLALLAQTFWLSALDLFRMLVPPKRKSVGGHVVLITGASRGLGRQMAMSLAREGATIVLWSSKQANVDKVASEIRAEGGEAFAFECDVSSERQVERVSREVQRRVGPVDILVNNAGVFTHQGLLYQNSADIRRTFDINLLAHYWTIRQFLPAMLERGGQIVAVASVAGFVGGPNTTGYCGSKFAVLGLMESLDKELFELPEQRGRKVKLTTICPGAFREGLLSNPSSRFPRLMPVVSLEEMASASVDSILRDKEFVVIPRRIGFLVRLSQSIFPRKVVKLQQRLTRYVPGDVSL